MHKHASIAKTAAVVACSAALAATPAVALAANGGATQSAQTVVSTQAVRDSHTWTINNYNDTQDSGSTASELTLLHCLQDWWPKRYTTIGNRPVAYDNYRLLQNSQEVYRANANSDVLKLHSGTYTVQGGDDPTFSWNDIDWSSDKGTFTLKRYWNAHARVVGSPKQASGSTAGGIMHNGNPLYDSGMTEVNEGESFSFTAIAVPGYTVQSVTVDDVAVSPDASGVYTIAARDGQTGANAMKNSDIKVTYTKNTTLSLEPLDVEYDPDYQSTLDLIRYGFVNGAATLKDGVTGEVISGLTEDDFTVTTDEDLTVGVHRVTLAYKGTVGGATSEYTPFSTDVNVTVLPLELELSWDEEVADGTIAFEDAAEFDFDASHDHREDLGVSIETTFYRGNAANADAELAAAPTEPGTYTEVAELVTDDANITAEKIVRTFTIAPATTRTVFDEEDVHVSYDGVAHALNARAFHGEEEAGFGDIAFLYTGTTAAGDRYESADAPVDAGEYEVTATYTDVNGYYATSEGHARLTIEKREVTIRVDNASKTEGEADPELTFAITEGEDGWQGAESILETIGASVARGAGETPGDYPIVFSANDTDNFDLSIENGTFTIVKKDEPVVPGKPDSGNTGSTTKPAAKKDTKKKAKAALPGTGDVAMAAPIAAGAAGIAALGAAAVAGKKRRNN